MDEDIFLGYSTSSKAYKIYNKCTLVVEESIHVIFDEASNPSLRKEDSIDDDTSILENGLKELNLEEKSTQREDEATKDVEQEKKY